MKTKREIEEMLLDVRIKAHRNGPDSEIWEKAKEILEEVLKPSNNRRKKKCLT